MSAGRRLWLLFVMWLVVGSALGEDMSGRVAFPRDGGVYVLDLGSGREVEVVKGLALDRAVEWSPNGKEILFSKRVEDVWDLWVVGVDGRGARNLTNVQAGGARCGAWSPDGAKVAFMRDKPQGVWVVGRDGKEARRLTHDGFVDERPAWSADGRRIVYQEFGFVDESARAEAKFKMELFVVGVDGAGKKKIVMAEGSSDTASFSPRGDKLLYRGVRGGNGEVCVLDVASGEEKVLTKTAAEGHAPSWSVDGARIAFWRDGEDGPGLFVMRDDGAGQRKLASVKTGVRVGRLAWSADSKWLVFGGSEVDDGVWVVSSEGGEAKQVARGCGAWARWEPVAKRE